MKNSEEKTYTNNINKTHGFGIWVLMFSELYTAKELILILAKRNVSVKYRQSILSYLWIIIPPVFAVIVFSYLTNLRIINVGDTPIPYLSYALLNISIWLLFANILISSTKSLVDAGNLVTRVNFPKVALVISSISDALLEFLIRLIAVAIVFVIEKVSFGWGIIFTPLLLMPLVLMSLGLGFILSIMNLLIRDTLNILGIVLTMGMFLTPVLYPPPTMEPFIYINMINPISPFLENIHSLLITGTLVNTPLLVVSASLSLLVFLVGWRIFNISLPRISERA